MKNISLILLTVLFSTTLYGQDKVHNNEFSLNATGFVANYFNLGGVNSNSIYVIDYKRRLGANLYFRSGLDASYTNSNSAQSNLARSYFNTKSFDLRLGVERRKQLSEKWFWHYGVDVIGGMNYNTSTSDQQFTNDRFELEAVTRISATETENIGIGPVTGLRWQISPRISIWTEGRLYLNYVERKNLTRWEDVSDGVKNRNGSFNFDSNSSTSYGSSAVTVLPLDIYVTFNF